MEYEPIIGLEIHAELLTRTKMFCSCLNDPEEKIPNKNICPVCMGHPGTLPVINKEAVRKVILVGLAVNSKIPEYSKFDRKNYFYPDLPKGYQISQYDEPLCVGGELPLYLSSDLQEMQKTIKITRIHLEEDVGKLIHSPQGDYSLIDFNRAGVPLMELVTEPVIHSGREARLFAQGLQLSLRTLGVSAANMEKGQMRCEVNISLRPVKEKKLGTKVEIKNLNSFLAVEKSINYEIQRQKRLLEAGEKIIQETRGWDAEKEITYSQRTKEEAQDYRYFSEPDLPPLQIWSNKSGEGLFDLEELKKELPELPWFKKTNLMREYGLSSLQANILIQDEKINSFWEKIIENLKTKGEKTPQTISLAANYLFSDFKGYLEKENINWEDLKLNPQDFVEIILLLSQDKISSRVAKDVLGEIMQKGGNIVEIIKKRGLEKINNPEALNSLIEQVIKENERAVNDFLQGKKGAIQFLVGQGMAKTKGAADPRLLEKILREKLQKKN